VWFYTILWVYCCVYYYYTCNAATILGGVVCHFKELTWFYFSITPFSAHIAAILCC